jgi:hypothetical protein
MWHINYFEKVDDFYCKGVTIQTPDILDAIIIFKDKYRNCIINNIYNVN